MPVSYQLPAGTLLYAVFKLRRPGIYGLPPVMPNPADKQFPLFAQQAEQQLADAGLGQLDFDGNFALDTDFAALLGACCACHAVAGAAVHRDSTWTKFTLYPEASALLQRDEAERCILSRVDDPAAALVAALNLPTAEASDLAPLRVDTTLLEQKDREGLVAAGCTEEQADVILAGFAGTGGYAHITRTQFHTRQDEAVLLYGADRILSAAVEYTETQELLCLTPITAQAAAEQVRAFAAPLFDQEEWEQEVD